MPSRKLVGVALGFGAGALISAISFELTSEALELGGADATALGLALGALAFYAGDRAIGARDKRMGGGEEDSGSPLALLLGSVLDGVPESAVIGTTLLAGGEIGVAVLAAVFVSNLPEGIGGGDDMIKAGRSRANVLSVWAAVTVVCGLSSALGYGILDGASGDAIAILQSFAAGGVLVLLVDELIPKANDEGPRWTGLVAVLGFAVATLLSSVG
jgi:ZIP family zinc transporter